MSKKSIKRVVTYLKSNRPSSSDEVKFIKAIVNRDQIARLFDVTTRSVNLFAKESDFPRVSRGHYDLVRCIQWYIHYLRRKTDEAFRRSEAMQSSEEKKARCQAEILDMKVRQIRGELAPVEEMVKVASDLVVTMRNRLMALPRRAASQIETTDKAEIEIILDQIVRDALNDIAEIPARIRAIAASQRKGIAADYDIGPAALEKKLERVGRRVHLSKPGGFCRAR